MDGYRVIGLDLSKKSTGVSVMGVENNALIVEEVFSIKQFKVDNFNKLYFYSVNLLMVELEKVFQKYNYDFTVALEFNTFGDFSSELQFYLTQAVLDLCYKNHIDVVGYAPLFLKKFIKFLVLDKNIRKKDYFGIIDKVKIRKIYETVLYPLNEGVIPVPKELKDDDSIDAFFLGLLGSIFHKDLGFIHLDALNSPMNIESLGQKKFDSLLITDSEYYRNKYLSWIQDFKFINIELNSSGVKFGKQYKEMLKDMDNNKYLALESKIFFPFSKLQYLTYKMRAFRLKNPKEFESYWVNRLKTRSSWFRSKYPEDRDIILLCNKKGEIFLYPGNTLIA